MMRKASSFIIPRTIHPVENYPNIQEHDDDAAVNAKPTLKCEIPPKSNPRVLRRSLSSPFYKHKFSNFVSLSKSSHKEDIFPLNENGRLGLNDPKLTPRTPTRDNKKNLKESPLPGPGQSSSTLTTMNNVRAHTKMEIEDKSNNLRNALHKSLSLSLYDSSGLVGLDNLGNTCYMNAGLQCLIHTCLVSEYFLQGKYKRHLCHKNSTDTNVAESLGMLISSIYQQKPFSTVNPMHFKQEINEFAPDFDGYEQQDSHEFLRIVLDRLEEELRSRKCDVSGKKVEKLSDEKLNKLCIDDQIEYWWSRHVAMNSSFVAHTFCGQFMNEVECLCCQHRTLCFDPFYDLSLPIPKEPSTISTILQRTHIRNDVSYNKNTEFDHRLGSSFTLEDCLSCFTKKEVLDGVNKIHCERCKTAQRSTRRLMIARFPRVLVIHLKRFDNMGGKVRKKVSFPLKGLDLSVFSCRKEFKQPPIYDLYAVNNHIGTSFSGHYTA